MCISPCESKKHLKGDTIILTIFLTDIIRYNKLMKLTNNKERFLFNSSCAYIQSFFFLFSIA